jgi:hypothetical protein
VQPCKTDRLTLRGLTPEARIMTLKPTM